MRGQAGVGEWTIGKIEQLELLQSDEVFQSFVADGCAGQVEVFQLAEFSDVRQSSIGDLRPLEEQPFERLGGRNRRESVVAGRGQRQIEPLQLVARAESGQSGVGNLCLAQAQTRNVWQR